MYNLDRYEGGIFEKIAIEEEVDGYDLRNIFDCYNIINVNDDTNDKIEEYFASIHVKTKVIFNVKLN